ncbi:MAG: hypothetical protein OEZ39_20265 [Gammaproteobacteria bacterium]|nr:hypothetical protein [Gammaproteobacteria bacterium]
MRARPKRRTLRQHALLPGAAGAAGAASGAAPGAASALATRRAARVAARRRAEQRRRARERDQARRAQRAALEAKRREAAIASGGGRPIMAPEPAYAEEQYAEPGYDESAYAEEDYGEPDYDVMPYDESAYAEEDYGEPDYDVMPYDESAYGTGDYGEPDYDVMPYGDQAATYQQPTVGLTPVQAEYLAWMESEFPEMYDEVSSEVGMDGLGADVPTSTVTAGSTGQPAEEPSMWSNIISAVKEIAPAYTQYKQQKEIMRVQTDRAKKGLPPLETSQYAPTARVITEVGGETRMGIAKLAIPIALGVGALGLLYTLKKRRR